MATLWIREYANPSDNSYSAGSPANAPLPNEPGTDQTPVTFSTSTQSAAFAEGTRYVGLIADAAFHYVVGQNPIATVNALKIPADTPYFISGDLSGKKIAIIAAD